MLPDNDHTKFRLAHLAALREAGVDPWPTRYEVTFSAANALAQQETLIPAETPISVAGRIVAWRPHGKAIFGHLVDASGQIQFYLKKDIIGDAAFALTEDYDIGDFLGLKGPLFVTRTGETTIHVTEVTFLAKSLRPLPEKYHGLQDKELRYRQRYLDLVANPEVAQAFRIRAKLITAIRGFLDEMGFLEVETPVLQPLYGGAAARPFTTHHNAQDMKLFLRIALELYLKRLIVGGLERVYEIGRNFRNEGMDRLHNPEFTMLEFYQAYADYGDLMNEIEGLIVYCADRVLGTRQITYGSYELSLEPPFQRLPMMEAIRQYAGVEVHPSDLEGLREVCRDRSLTFSPAWGAGKMLDLIFSRLVEPHLVGPVFITEHPVETSPLAKRSKTDPNFTERFELFIACGEVVNAFSELNDPLDQRERLESQAALRAAGDEEAMGVDEDFLTALETGMPPCGGVGLGVDRLAMLFANVHSIRDVLFFPLMKREEE